MICSSNHKCLPDCDGDHLALQDAGRTNSIQAFPAQGIASRNHSTRLRMFFRAIFRDAYAYQGSSRLSSRVSCMEQAPLGTAFSKNDFRHRTAQQIRQSRGLRRRAASSPYILEKQPGNQHVRTNADYTRCRLQKKTTRNRGEEG